MIKSITFEEFVTHFEKVFFSNETRRIDIEFLANIHEAEQESEKNKNKEHPMFQGRSRPIIEAFTLKNEGSWYDNTWMQDYQKSWKK
jgi:hypothetical protein